jgi:hypothetical protein
MLRRHEFGLESRFLSVEFLGDALGCVTTRMVFGHFEDMSQAPTISSRLACVEPDLVEHAL